MTNLHVEQHGRDSNASTVVLLSSIGTTRDAWANQIPALSGDHRVITVDHRGHGGSDTPDVQPGTATVEQLAGDILAALDGAGVERFHIVGLSLGGAFAQWIAAHTDRVDKAVFACTATYLGGEEKWSERTRIARTQGMEAMTDGFLENWFTQDFRDANPETIKQVRDMVCSIDAEGYAQNGDALAKWDFASELRKITCPVLTIAGADDPATPPENLAVIAGGVAGPAESVVIEPGSHQLAIERPEEFNQVLTRFLRD